MKRLGGSIWKISVEIEELLVYIKYKIFTKSFLKLNLKYSSGKHTSYIPSRRYISALEKDLLDGSLK